MEETGRVCRNGDSSRSGVASRMGGKCTSGAEGIGFGGGAICKMLSNTAK